MKEKNSFLGWIFRDWIYLFIFFGIGMLWGVSQNLDFVTESVTEQCNKYIVEKYGYNENLQILDPYLLKESGFYDNPDNWTIKGFNNSK